MLVNSGVLALLSGIVVLVVHALGILHAAHAVMTVRSSSGAIAWGISLITFPWLAIPLYWILGRTKFHGYTEALRSVYAQHYKLVQEAYGEIAKFKVAPPQKLAQLQPIAKALTAIPFTSGNAAQLLINAEQTYEAMLSAIAQRADARGVSHKQPIISY